MDFDAATFAVISTYLDELFLLKHADLRALIEPFPRQSHHDRLQLLVAQRHATIMSHTSADKAAFVKPSRTQPQAKAIMHQHLHTIGALVHEQVRMMGSRFTEHIHDAGKRFIYAARMSSGSTASQAASTRITS